MGGIALVVLLSLAFLIFLVLIGLGFNPKNAMLWTGILLSALIVFLRNAPRNQS